jgi:hypothetical protein
MRCSGTFLIFNLSSMHKADKDSLNTLHSVLSEEEKHSIKVAIERYKQTGKLVSLKEISLTRPRKRP